MSKPGRNDPCPCGSGKKYKNCHLPIEEASRAEQRRLEAAQDTLLPKLIEAARGMPAQIAPAFTRYWDGKYTIEQLAELDEHETRGAERFLTWFAFDYPLEDGRTLVEQLASPGDAQPTIELDSDETRLLADWAGVRLRPYMIERVLKGSQIGVRDMLDGQAYTIEDHAASRSVLVDEVLVVHLLPVGTRYFIGGAAAHLTSDTRDKLSEFAGLHLEAFQREHPAAGWADLLRARSEVLNHFVMQLPVEAPDPTILDQILMQTRVSLKLAGESLGIGRTPDEPGA